MARSLTYSEAIGLFGVILDRRCDPVIFRIQFHRDCYLIPYEKDGYIALIAQVSIKGDVADFSSAYVPSVKTQDVVRPTMEEARKVLSENGYDGSLSARLVWKPCEQTQSLVHPVWEFEQADGDLIYVGYNPFDDMIQIYDELTEKTIMG